MPAVRSGGGLGAPDEPASLTIQWDDSHKMKSTTNLKVIPAITDVQVFEIITALEALSNAKCCQWSITFPGNVAGNKANSTLALYPDALDFARLRYSSAASCRDTTGLSIPAPLASLFSGAQNRIINPNDVNLAALNAALTGILADSEGNIDFEYDSGYRDTRQANAPNVV